MEIQVGDFIITIISREVIGALEHVTLDFLILLYHSSYFFIKSQEGLLWMPGEIC